MEPMEAMDIAASKAQADLDDIDFTLVAPVSEWWAKWYMAAGHKRLGRILLEHQTELEDPDDN